MFSLELSCFLLNLYRTSWILICCIVNTIFQNGLCKFSDKYYVLNIVQVIAFAILILILLISICSSIKMKKVSYKHKLLVNNY